MTYLEIQCRDPIVTRDGRPFGAGGKIRILPWVLPSVVAGSFRTLLGKKIDPSFSGDLPEQLKQVSVHGFFPLVDGQIYLPKPEDCIAKPQESPDAIPELLAAKPQGLEPGQGCDLPNSHLLPVMLTREQSSADFKPAPIPDWWPLKAFVHWLTCQPVQLNNTFLQKPEEDHRTHLAVDETTKTADEGMIFSTASLSLEALRRYRVKENAAESALATYPVRIGCNPSFQNQCQALDESHTLGGERRLAHWKAVADHSKLWACPEEISSILSKEPKNIRMALATPGIFQDGWKPGWLRLQPDGSLQGNPPDCDLTLKLVGASVSRWKAVSGWSLAHPRGPKPTRRMVPAGSIYFFEHIAGDASSLKKLWLHSVADNEQDQRDGFGLATWGIW